MEQFEIYWMDRIYIHMYTYLYICVCVYIYTYVYNSCQRCWRLSILTMFHIFRLSKDTWIPLFSDAKSLKKDYSYLYNLYFLMCLCVCKENTINLRKYTRSIKAFEKMCRAQTHWRISKCFQKRIYFECITKISKNILWSFLFNTSNLKVKQTVIKFFE